jgi:hypothetical protein
MTIQAADTLRHHDFMVEREGLLCGCLCSGCGQHIADRKNYHGKYSQKYKDSIFNKLGNEVHVPSRFH